MHINLPGQIPEILALYQKCGETNSNVGIHQCSGKQASLDAQSQAAQNLLHSSPSPDSLRWCSSTKDQDVALEV